VLLVAGAFRFHGLAERSLWLDEARVANYARQSIVDNITKTRLGSTSPIAFPLLLQVVQRVDDTAFAVRLTAAIASLMAVVVILALPRLGVDSSAALIAASILAVSPSQIRYAQEVREYSLSVLMAALMIFALVAFQRRRNGAWALLLFGLFVVPLVQYGLVLFAVALLILLAFGTWRRRGLKEVLRTVVPATVALASGGFLTVLLTLRGQWRHGEMWYLQDYFYDGSIFDLGAVLQFFAMRVPALMTYLTLGDGFFVLLVPVFGLLLLARPNAQWEARHLLTFAICSVSMVAAWSLARLYPFGPVRQDLFLAPVVAMTFGAGWSMLNVLLPKKHRSTATAIYLVAVLGAGAFGVVRADPYLEVEDIKSVIAGLDDRSPGDPVYVYYGARPALRFYRVDSPDFVYGSSHRKDLGGYATEFRALVGEEAPRVWLVFSHSYVPEVRRFLDEIAAEWSLERVVHARGASLHKAQRRDETMSDQHQTDPAE